MEGPHAPRRGGASPWLIALAVPAAAGAGALVLVRRPVEAGVAVAVAGGSLAFAGIEARRDTGRIRFLHGVTERVADAAVLAPIAWVAAEDERVATAAAALAALGIAYVAAYLRTKAIALGFDVGEPPVETSAHFLLLALGLLVVPVLPVALWLAAGVDLQTVVRLALRVRRQGEPT